MTIRGFTREGCVACGVCDMICPNDVIRTDGTGYPYIAYPQDCTGCRLCQERCAFEVIDVKPGSNLKFSTDFAMQNYLLGLGISPERVVNDD